MYYYSTVNNVTMTHSEVLEEKNIDYISVHFERPNENGFDFLDIKLPGEFVRSSFGFSEDEIMELKNYTKNNAPLIWEFAKKGGGMSA